MSPTHPARKNEKLIFSKPKCHIFYILIVEKIAFGVATCRGWISGFLLVLHRDKEVSETSS